MLKRVLLLSVLLSIYIVFILGHSFSEDTKNFQIKKHPEIQQIKPKKPVRIKLRRAADDKYTWEITGDDVDEIVRADRKIRKMLKIK